MTESVLIVANPAACATTREMADVVARAFDRPGSECQVYWTTGPADAASVAAKERCDLIVGIGGDGTMREIAEGLLTRPQPPALLALPAGTGNSLCRSLWGERDWRQVLELALDPAASRVSSLDVLHIVETGRYALLGASAGFLAETLIAAKKVKGATGVDGYRAGAAAVIGDMPTFPARVTVDGTDVFEGTAFLANVGGGRYRAAGLLHLMPESIMDDGVLDVCVIAGMSAAELAGFIPLASMGEHLDHRKVTYAQGREIRVERLDALPLALESDGDVEPEPLHTMTIGVKPGALPLWAPR